jgi:hypothetical protein
LDGLAGMGEHDPGRDDDEFDTALLYPAVGAGGGGVGGGTSFQGRAFTWTAPRTGEQ